MKRVLSLLSVAAAGLVVGHANASPLQMFGFGGRSPAMGATGVAGIEGFECLYLNPAGLSAVTRKRLSAGTVLGTFDLDGVDRDIETIVGVEVGGALPLPLGGDLKDRVGLAVGVYFPTARLNRARAPRPGEPFYALLENRAETVGMQAGLGVRLTDRWSVGASLLILAALRGTINITTDASGRFTTVSEQQLIADFAPIFGARWKPRTDLDLGATFRYRSRSGYDIVVTNDLANTLPVTLPELRIAGVAQYDPMTLAVEAAWRPRPGLLALGQLAWEHWSAFPLPTENPVEAMPPQESADFHDTLVPRLGAEWTVGAFAARLGYAFVMTPAPEMTGQQALLDNHRHLISVGLGLDLPAAFVPVHVDLWFQAHLLMGRHHDRPDGEEDIDTSGQLLVGGALVGVDL